MSKLDAQRAMREAKWARTQERAAAAQADPSSSTRRPRPPVAPPLERPTKTAPAAAAAPSEALCGHASMNGRTCTRPAGHPQKSHRYS